MFVDRGHLDLEGLLVVIGSHGDEREASKAEE